ncbi:MAG: histidine phosphatase family protein [Desulfobacterales bacterium]
MVRIYLVRHGKAASGWGEQNDPGLNDPGRRQSAEVADTLYPLGPIPIVTSPLLRTRQTAEPLAHKWGVSPRIEAGVAEIPSPPARISDRAAWLRSIMTDEWHNLESGLQSWRSNVIATLNRLKEDTVVVTHFIAINAAVGEALGDPKVVVFRPDNTSITIIDTDGACLRLVKKGREDNTIIL